MLETAPEREYIESVGPAGSVWTVAKIRFDPQAFVKELSVVNLIPSTHVLVLSSPSPYLCPMAVKNIHLSFPHSAVSSSGKVYLWIFWSSCPHKTRTPPLVHPLPPLSSPLLKLFFRILPQAITCGCESTCVYFISRTMRCGGWRCFRMTRRTTSRISTLTLCGHPSSHCVLICRAKDEARASVVAGGIANDEAQSLYIAKVKDGQNDHRTFGNMFVSHLDDLILHSFGHVNPHSSSWET